MLSVKVPQKGAERVKRYLAKRNLMDNNYRIISRDEFIYFPISSSSDVIEHKNLAKMGAEIAHLDMPKAQDGRAYADKLKESIKTKYKSAAKGYDVIGEIAVVDANMRDAKAMGKSIMAINKNVKTVISKAGPIKGEYRVRKYAYVMGKKRYSTIYHENGAAFRFDVRKTFFSTRLAYERNRVANESKDGESVIVMFAGAGPFAIEIGKLRKNSHVVGIELNKDAYGYMAENIKLNRAGNVTAKLGDVKKVAKKYRKFADRIVMPLPKDSYEFLGSVLTVAKKRCVVHYYAFGDRDTAFVDHISKLKAFFAKHGKKVKILFKRIVRTYSANEIEIVIDFLVY